MGIRKENTYHHHYHYHLLCYYYFDKNIHIIITGLKIVSCSRLEYVRHQIIFSYKNLCNKHKWEASKRC